MEVESVLFLGIVLIALSFLGGIVAFFVFKHKKNILEEKLDLDYGKRGMIHEK